MSLSGTTVLIIIFAAIFFLTLNLVRSLLKALRITLFIMFLLGILVTYYVIEDAKDFADTINEVPTSYLLDDGNIRTGFSAMRLNLSTFTPLSEQDIETIREDPKGKIIIIEKSILSIVNDQNLELDVNEMFSSANDEMRAQAFAYSLAASIEEQGTFEMLMHIREGNITIQPKTVVVFVFTSTPRQIYKQARAFVVSEASKQFDLVQERVRS